MTATTDKTSVSAKVDWAKVYYSVLTSRRLDEIEETKLVPEKKVLYQFSARGHDVAQAILGQFINHPNDGVGADIVFTGRVKAVDEDNQTATIALTATHNGKKIFGRAVAVTKLA